MKTTDWLSWRSWSGAARVLFLAWVLPVFSASAQVVVDNSDATGVTITGAWTASTATGGYQGANYLHDGNAGKGSKSVRFTPNLPSAGSYEVFLRWTADSNRASNVPIDIVHAGGTEEVQVDQRSSGGTWVSLGTYNFAAGTGGSVLISNAGTNGYVIADAARFVSVSSGPLPTIAGTWQLTFQDEFDGSSVNGTKWRLGQHWSGIGGVGGVEPANITVSSGHLRMKSTQEAVSYGGANYAYSTGEISTFFNFRQQYGYFEARIKYPAVTGLWPAFWLMPDRGAYGWKDGYFRSYIKFDLTGVNPGTINTAELRLKVSAVESGGSNNVVFMKVGDDSWSESTITWNNMPTPNPVWLAQRWNQAVAGQDMTVDVKDFVAQQMAGDKKISLLIADTFMRTKNVKFHSSEAAAQADRPRLVINGVTYYATEDAYVRWGTLANNNYGGAAELVVEDSWGDTATTQNDGMEVDIMESLGIWGPNVTQHAVHWDGYGADHKAKGWPDIGHPASADGFHTYGVYWQAGLLEFYVDGKKTAEWSNAEVMSCPAYMILSFQLGGWDNNNPTSAVNNQVMQVDWVRAWTGTRTPIASSEVIVDNANTSSVTATGAWTASTATGGYYGSNYAHDGNTAKGSKSFRFRPTITTPGTYWIYGRWTSGTNRASNVPFDITGSGGTATATLSQQVKGGKWVFLGESELATGTNGNVLIRTTGTDGYVIADAIRFLRVGN